MIIGSDFLSGDPTVVLIEETDQLHMFVNEIFHGILHFSAPHYSPTHFTQHDPVISLAGAVRPFVLRRDDHLYLYYEQYHAENLFRQSSIMMRQATIIISGDMVELLWEEESVEVLSPDLDWEMIGTKRVGNPFVHYNPTLALYQWV